MDVVAVSTSPQVSSPEHVRQCSICCKPFLKESSFNRHVLYCRRTRHRRQARARVCQACSLAKVKCNLQPQCQRCTSKGIECVYDTTSNHSAPTSRPRVVEDSQIRPGAETSAVVPSGVTDEVAIQTSDELYARDDSDSYMDWNLIDFEANEIMSQSAKSSLPCLSEPVVSSGGLITDNNYGMEVSDFRTDTFDPQGLLATELSWLAQKNPQEESSYALTRTAYPLERVEGEHLSPIPRPDPLSNCNAKVMMQMLCAFPQMMLRRETLPPFIHGHWYNDSSSMEPALPQPLLNCMGVAQVFASHTLETKSFLWHTIQTEQRTAVEKADEKKLPKRVLLASIQAQLIYILMRITDNSMVEPGLNFRMLVIFQRLCDVLKSQCNNLFFQQESHNPSISWEDWVYAESRRRVALVWFLVTQMVHIKIGVPCDSFEEYREIPLPAPRSLWEARTRAGWQSEMDVYNTIPRIGMETVGDLIKVTRESNLTINKVKMNVWNAGIDNLGLLLNLSVASM